MASFMDMRRDHIYFPRWPHLHLPLLAAAPSLLAAVLHRLSPLPSAALAFFRVLPPPHPLDASLALVRLLAPHPRHHPAARALLRDLSLRHPLSSPLLLPSLLAAADGPRVPSWLVLVLVLAQSARAHDAVRVFDQMRARGLGPDAHACTALLTALARARMTATARRVFSEMARAGLAVTTHVYNAMLHVCLKAGDAARAEALVTRMDAAGVPLDLFSYNTVLATAAPSRLLAWAAAVATGARARPAATAARQRSRAGAELFRGRSGPPPLQLSPAAAAARMDAGEMEDVRAAAAAEEVISSRGGSVLGKKTILKSDHFPADPDFDAQTNEERREGYFGHTDSRTHMSELLNGEKLTEARRNGL